MVILPLSETLAVNSFFHLALTQDIASHEVHSYNQLRLPRFSPDYTEDHLSLQSVSGILRIFSGIQGFS